MNCCNDFGQCVQDHGCPARAKPPSDLPVVMFDAPYQWLHDLVHDALRTFGGVLAAAVVGVAIGVCIGIYQTF